MDMDFDDSVPRALRRYVRLVSEALGLSGESWYVQGDEPISAYIALDRPLDRFRDLALLWDENHGWSAAIETHSGDDLLVIAYLGQDVVPPPATVAAWADGVFDRERPTGEPPSFSMTHDDLADRLAVYVTPVWGEYAFFADDDLVSRPAPGAG